jgi:hypothetical protein
MNTCPVCDCGLLVEFKRRRRVLLQGTPSWVWLFRSRCSHCEGVTTTNEQHNRNLEILAPYDRVWPQAAPEMTR